MTDCSRKRTAVVAVQSRRTGFANAEQERRLDDGEMQLIQKMREMGWQWWMA